MDRATDGLRTAALALGFVAGLKVSTLTGQQRVLGTLVFMAIWLVGGAIYWQLSGRAELSQRAWVRPMWRWVAGVFDILCIIILGLLWGRG